MRQPPADPAVTAILELHEARNPATPIRAVVQRALDLGYTTVPPASGSSATYLRLVHAGTGGHSATLYVDGTKLTVNGKALRPFAATLAGARQTRHDVQFRFGEADPAAVLEAFRAHVAEPPATTAKPPANMAEPPATTAGPPATPPHPSPSRPSSASAQHRVRRRPAPSAPYPVAAGSGNPPSGRGRRKSTRVGLLGIGVLAALVVAGLVGSRGGGASSTASDLKPAPVTASTAAAVPTVAVQTTSQAPALPPPPTMAMSCPGPGTTGSATFGHQITATAPYTVAIDYGDGDHYTNDDQHLGAIFSHTYQAVGSFNVTAFLTDAAGQTTTSACTYTWAPVAVAPPVSTGTGGSEASGDTSSAGSGDSYTNSDGNTVSGPVQAPSAPPGATAQCRDGSYSFSQHRSGTCSHHHGVAQWLNG